MTDKIKTVNDPSAVILALEAQVKTLTAERNELRSQLYATVTIRKCPVCGGVNGHAWNCAIDQAGDLA